MTSSAMICGDDHPAALPRSRPRTQRKSPPTRRAWPIQSIRRGSGFFDSRSRTVPIRQSSPSGRLTKKIERQPTDAVSRPPSKGPNAKAPPIVAP